MLLISRGRAGAERGKFHRPLDQLKIPIYLDPQVSKDLDILRKDIELLRTKSATKLPVLTPVDWAAGQDLRETKCRGGPTVVNRRVPLPQTRQFPPPGSGVAPWNLDVGPRSLGVDALREGGVPQSYPPGGLTSRGACRWASAAADPRAPTGGTTVSWVPC